MISRLFPAQSGYGSGQPRIRHIRYIGRLDADEGASTGRSIASLGHFSGDIGAEAVELFADQIESGVANALQKIFALNPERAAIVPGGPAAVFAVAKCALSAELRKPAAGQALIFREKGQFMRRGTGVLQRKDSRQGTAQAPRLDEARRITGLRKMLLQDQDAPGDGGQDVEEFARFVQVIKETAAES